MRHKKIEGEILQQLNNRTNSKIIALADEYSHIDLAGYIGTRKVCVEVKERRTYQDYGDADGWILEDSKVRGMYKQLRQLGENPDDVEMYYCNVWQGNTYLFDVKQVINTDAISKTMNKMTDFGGDHTNKVRKDIYLLKNASCILHKRGINLNEL